MNDLVNKIENAIHQQLSLSMLIFLACSLHTPFLQQILDVLFDQQRFFSL